jgi:hypothetical protein
VLGWDDVVEEAWDAASITDWRNLPFSGGSCPGSQVPILALNRIKTHSARTFPIQQSVPQSENEEGK